MGVDVPKSLHSLVSSKTMSNAKKQKILALHSVEPSHLIGRGMEAEVYALGDDAVLKLYDSATFSDDLQALREFYDQLDDSVLSYSLPKIRQVEQHNEYTVVVEKRLSGQPLADVVESHQAAGQLYTLFGIYVSAVDELSRLEMPADAKFYKLFGSSSARSAGDWHSFLLRWLDEKLVELTSYFARDVADYAQKIEWMRKALSEPYSGVYRLIHGDFCLGNLLVDEEVAPTAVIDFGLFTMYGDPLFDIATAWVFFDMYDELKANVRERLLDVIIQRFGGDIREKLYLYVLLYSFLSANTYAAGCSDGHYAWSVAEPEQQRVLEISCKVTSVFVNVSTRWWCI